MLCTIMTGNGSGERVNTGERLTYLMSIECDSLHQVDFDELVDDFTSRNTSNVSRAITAQGLRLPTPCTTSS